MLAPGGIVTGKGKWPNEKARPCFDLERTSTVLFPSVREFDGVGTGFADLYLTEAVIARVGLELMRPGGHRRQPNRAAIRLQLGGRIA
jgi:hypothetical protein